MFPQSCKAWYDDFISRDLIKTLVYESVTMVVRRLIFEVCSNCGKKIVDDEIAVLVDEHNDLLFCDDACVHEYFEADINNLEIEHMKMRAVDDIPVKDFGKYEHFLQLVLNEPDEIWEGEAREEEAPLNYYIGEFFHDKEPVYYVAVAYSNETKPSFVYMHFPTNQLALVEKYRKGELVFDGAHETELQLEDDEMTDGNIAIELYNDMLENRSEVDIDAEDFASYSDLKLATVEKPEEIWKRIDDLGNTFVIYISHHTKNSESLAYVVVAVEDEIVGGAVPIFGFPTLDQKLLDRFRTGELVFKGSEDQF
jgi:hypothetical protein